MEIFLAILALLTGCGVFIIGMKVLSTQLEKVAGGKMKNLLKKISSNRFAGVGIGAAVTAVVQSSDATTVMTIGLVNASVMSLTQAASVIMGANIGTTVTGLLVSLSSLDISVYLSFLTFIGAVMLFFKNNKVKNIGGALAGLGLIFVGLNSMSMAFKNSQALTNACSNIISAINFPLLLILLGFILTAILQSSSAMTGLVIVMVGQGALSIESALFIVLGTNIGTCVTALLASIGTNVNAKRTAFIHLMFNVIGTVIFTIFIWIFNKQIAGFLNFILPSQPQLQIAIFHLVFNLTTTILLLPLLKQLVQFATFVVKDKKKEKLNKFALKYVDDRLLRSPHVALMQVKKEIEYMANLSKENLKLSFDCLINNSINNEKEINEREDLIDYTNNALTTFLIKLSPLLDSDCEKVVGSYFHVVNDIERIGDHAINILDEDKKMEKDDLSFSTDGKSSLNDMFKKVMDMYDIAIECFDESKSNKLKLLDKYEDELDVMKDQLAYGHFLRLTKGTCQVESGEFFGSLISGLERVGDHLVNIAYSIYNPTGSQTLENASETKTIKNI